MAQYNLGLAYNTGQGVTKDYKQAVYWYQKAAKQGNVRAEYALGLMYINGKLIAQDYPEAYKWFLRAANQGLEEAQTILGAMYAEGKGVTQNHIEAYKWHSLAGGKETVFSEKARKAQSFVAEHMTPEQISEAQRRASEWIKTYKK